MTVEELMEVLSRCEKHKVVIVERVESSILYIGAKPKATIIQNNIDAAVCFSPSSTCGPVRLMLGDKA